MIGQEVNQHAQFPTRGWVREAKFARESDPGRPHERGISPKIGVPDRGWDTGKVNGLVAVTALTALGTKRPWQEFFLQDWCNHGKGGRGATPIPRERQDQERC